VLGEGDCAEVTRGGGQLWESVRWHLERPGAAGLGKRWEEDESVYFNGCTVSSRGILV
jgi:hypothetical protein